ncbi:MAG: cellulase family glycosylhydrolase [Planctomycetia bacterium]|nr:cellulase family glycosylhydrolase [Planctomycetia bacterium]
MQTTSSSRRDFLRYSAAFLSSSALLHTTPACISQTTSKSELPEPKWFALPRWRGFNLCEKFNVGSATAFLESDFQWIHQFGFNFVRLPMDYRTWIEGDDKRRFKEKTLQEIDQALQYGQSYGVHVCMNFHRAPGYTVANPPERPLIWQSEEALEMCALHWQTFAKRYRGVPNRYLSFNLFNEPAGCTQEEYCKVVSRICQAIRSEDPDRLIICDGLSWGQEPCMPLKDLKVAQATRGYSPMEISHYGANWVNSRNYPYPRWPMISFNGLMPSPGKSELPEETRRPWIIRGEFGADAKLRLKIGVVSQSATLVVKADDKEILRRKFQPRDGQGEWKEVVFSKEYNIYQNIYDLDVVVDIPSSVQTLTIQNVDGDWIYISELGIRSGNAVESTITGTQDWRSKEANQLRYDGKTLINELSNATKDRAWLYKENVEPWVKAKDAGIGVMVGEFGAYNKTPHDIALHWLEDMLANWRDAGLGWSLWNFRGSFGILDSGRTDIEYEDWHGHKLDRKMLELLQRY